MPPAPTLADRTLWYLRQSEQTPAQLSLALRACDRAIEEEGELVRTHVACGLAHWRAGNSREALRRLLHALSLEPDHIETVRTLSDILIRTRDYERAVNVLARAVTRHPRDYDLRLSYGAALRGTGQFGQAVEEYERAVELAPSRPDAYFNLAYLRHQCLMLGPEDARYAIENYEAFLERAEGVERLAAEYEWVSRRCTRQRSRGTRRGRGNASPWVDGCEPGLIQQILLDSNWIGRGIWFTSQRRGICQAPATVQRAPIDSP